MKKQKKDTKGVQKNQILGLGVN